MGAYGRGYLPREGKEAEGMTERDQGQFIVSKETPWDWLHPARPHLLFPNLLVSRPLIHEPYGREGQTLYTNNGLAHLTLKANVHLAIKNPLSIFEKSHSLSLSWASLKSSNSKSYLWFPVNAFLLSCTFLRDSNTGKNIPLKRREEWWNRKAGWDPSKAKTQQANIQSCSSCQGSRAQGSMWTSKA